MLLILDIINTLGITIGLTKGDNMRVWKAINIYLGSKAYRSLSSSSQKTYRYNLYKIQDTRIDGNKFGNKFINKISPEIINEVYDTWEAEDSTANANHLATVLSVVMNHHMRLESIQKNPMKFLKRRSSKPRSVVWEHDQVMTFLDTAFSKFDWRNIGLIVYMCYEWGQRPVDIRNLTFSQIDWYKRKVDITQTKRGAEVELPIPDELYPMLKQQETDWGFQEYVVPNHRASDGGYRPLTVQQMTALLKEVKADCGLPENLQVGDLRKTAIVQMIKGGATPLAIQSASGHKNVVSLNPYNKYCLETAKSALERRQR